MNTPLQLDPSQESALRMILSEPICIVTGGPGTGKTTILREALARMGNRDVALCAPTGKAAKRMSEATGTDARTIHRLLAYSPEDGGFWYGESTKLPHDVIIVDESSMVDVELFAALLLAIDERRTRLVLVGDYNQLPSVGPGAILSDLVKSGLVPCSVLTQVHRSAAESWVCVNAPRILAGDSFAMHTTDDFKFVEVESAANVPKFCAEIMALDPTVQILAPQRKGVAGTQVLNQTMQARFNPPRGNEPKWGSKDEALRVGDRVIHTKNDYELGVFNGEVGDVVDANSKALSVKYPDRSYPVEYSRAQARVLQLAYTLTIHKSQGSEWPRVIVVAHSTHTFMLTRQLLYTAVTRAKEGVFVVGDKKGIAAALKCKRDSTRNTALCDRIKGEM